MKFTCKNRCFYRSRLWRPGETLVAKPGEKVPHHFTEVGGAVAAVNQAKPSEPVALSQMIEKEAVIPDKPVALSQLQKGNRNVKRD